MSISEILTKDKLDSSDLRAILEAYFKNQEVTMGTVRSCFDKADISAIANAIQSLSLSDTKITEQALDLIKTALEIIKQELDKELSFQEKTLLLNRVADLIDKATEQAREHRKAKIQMTGILGGTALVVAGAVVLVFTRGKNKEIFANGVRIIKAHH